jgi:GxxExxY protein
VFIWNAVTAADVIVRGEVIPEIKSVAHILPLDQAQFQTYLRPSHCKVGLLLNFNAVSLRDRIKRRVL